MILRSKQETTLFDIQDYRGPVTARWLVELESFTYDPQTDNVSIRVRCKEVGSNFIHVRDFTVPAQGINFKKSQVATFFRNHFGNEYEEVNV